MSAVPFAPKPNKTAMNNVRHDYPSVAAYIDYLEDCAKVDSQRMNQCNWTFEINGTQGWFETSCGQIGADLPEDGVNNCPYCQKPIFASVDERKLDLGNEP